MTPDLALIKLAAFLHDPPHKPLVLGRGAGHEAYAEQVRQALGLPDLLKHGRDDVARRADHLASAADRPNFPSGVRADFWSAPALSHPLARARPEQPSAVSLGPLPGTLDLVVLTRGVERAAHVLRQQADGDPERLYLLLWRYFPEYLRAGEADPAAGVPPDQRLGLLWHALPADTRVPDHSLWDHLSITAAIAGALPQPAFLVFSLGPVQEFIAQARKTQDLWAGSYLLSYLAWAAMRPLCEELGPDCVLYPALHGQPLVDGWLSQKGVQPPESYALPSGNRQIASLPHKFVALVPLPQASDLAQRAAAEIASTWRSLAEEVRHYLEQQGLALDATTWQRQIDAHLETHWTVVPWPDPAQAEGDAQARRWVQAQLEPWLTADGLRDFWTTFNAYAAYGHYDVNAGTLYAPLHQLAQRVFAAAKLARRFAPGEEPGYKCTLCGRRTPALAGTAPYDAQRQEWARAAQALHTGDLRPEGAERLCAVCLVKRFASDQQTLKQVIGYIPAFPSTSSLATLPLRQWLIEHAIQLSALDDFLTGIDLLREAQTRHPVLDAAPVASPAAVPALTASVNRLSAVARQRAEALLQVDGEWLLKETYTRHESTLARQSPSHEVRVALGEAREALEELWKQTRRQGRMPPSPSPYYAILLMDGDRMGRWIGGNAHENTLRDLLHPEVLRALERHGGWEEVLGVRRLFGPSTHAALSSALLAYARYSVPWIVEREHAGRVVYAGGDDVLALLPLPSALPAAYDLRRAYSRSYVFVELHGRVYREWPSTPNPAQSLLERHMGPDATASAGIALVHHLYPLGAALEQLRRWEQEAKDRCGRDAFVVGVIRRSGPDLVFGGKWPLLPQLLDIQAAFARGALPDRTPYLIRELVERAGTLPRDDARSLVRSILQQRERPPSAAGQDPAALVLEVLDALGYDLAGLTNFLMIARFLAQEVNRHGAASLS